MVVFVPEDKLWTGTPQVLRYWFLDGTDVQKQKVSDAIDEWTWYANVQFQEVNKAEDGNVRISFNPDDGSWSANARDCERYEASKATMNLAWVDKNSRITQNERATILQQFGLVLGLLYEHLSPAHGNSAVRNVQAAIELYSKTQGWTVQEVYDKVINPYSISAVSSFSQVDITSIMHFPQPRELTGLPMDIAYNQKLDDLDKAYTLLYYPRKSIHPKAAQSGWTYAKALSVIGTPQDITNKILGFLQSDQDAEIGEINPQNIRATIAEWSRAAHAAHS